MSNNNSGIFIDFKQYKCRIIIYFDTIINYLNSISIPNPQNILYKFL